MRITTNGPSGPYEVRDQDPDLGHEKTVFSHKDLSCAVAFAQARLERTPHDPGETLEIDLYVRYRKGYHSTGFSALHVSNSTFMMGQDVFESLEDLFKHCHDRILSPLSFRITITLNAGFYAFSRENEEASGIYRSARWGDIFS
jgi:hypothetical protein